ncbi:MAG TPA: DUF2157 domain-containing protein [Verrucomicrobiae bacterium]|nr:DUF2157 domain-containing protein [Verrucomicrobiae bacterium]
MEEHAPHHRTAQILAILGGILVVMGILALIIASWASFTPTGRIITAVLPLVILYALTAFASRDAESHAISKYARITASVIAPFVLGVVVFQSGLYPQVDAALIAALALLSAANSGIIEFLYRDKMHTPLTITSLIVADVALVSWFNLEVAGAAALILITGALMIALALIQSQEPDQEERTTAWHSIGVIFFLASLFILPPALVEGMRGEEINATLIPLYYVAAGFLSLGLAVVYSRLWQANKDSHYYHGIRSFSEHLAAAFMIIPAALATLLTDSSGAFLVLLGASIVSIGLSTQIRVSWFRGLGVAGVVIAAIRLILLGIKELAAFWPILLLVGGILLILIAVLSTRRQTRWSHSLMVLPNTSWEHLGEELPQLAPAERAQVRHDEAGWFWFILAIAILWILSML